MSEIKEDHLAGQLAALKAVMLALINTHPKPAALAREIHRLTEAAQSGSLQTTVSEAYMHGLSQMQSDLLNHAAS